MIFSFLLFYSSILILHPLFSSSTEVRVEENIKENEIVVNAQVLNDSLPEELGKSEHLVYEIWSYVQDLTLFHVYQLFEIVEELLVHHGHETNKIDALFNDNSYIIMIKLLIHHIKQNPQIALLLCFLLKKMQELAKSEIDLLEHGKKKRNFPSSSLSEEKDEKDEKLPLSSLKHKSKKLKKYEHEKNDLIILQNLEKYTNFFSDIKEMFDADFITNSTGQEQFFIQVMYKDDGEHKLHELLSNNFKLLEYVPKGLEVILPVLSEQAIIEKAIIDDKFLREQLNKDSKTDNDATHSNLNNSKAKLIFWIKYFVEAAKSGQMEALNRHVMRVFESITTVSDFEVVSTAALTLFGSFRDYIRDQASKKLWKMPEDLKAMEMEELDDESQLELVLTNKTIVPLVPFIQLVRPGVYDDFNDFMVSQGRTKKFIRAKKFGLCLGSDNSILFSIGMDIKSIFIIHQQKMESKLFNSIEDKIVPKKINGNVTSSTASCLAGVSFGWNIPDELINGKERQRNTFILTEISQGSIIALSTKNHHRTPDFLEFGAKCSGYFMSELKEFIDIARDQDFIFIGMIDDWQ